MRSEIPPGTLLGGKYRLLRRIGRGGMGDVWIARNDATHADVAIKTLHGSERTPEHAERFRREARLAATISQRNVVRIFDLIDEPDGTLGLVMELLRGGTVEQVLLERDAFTPAQAVAVALPILAALAHVHEKGIIHRDIKPGNVFLAVEPDGHVIPKLLDFGIAKVPSASSNLTVDGNILGTPHYMSPEQIRHRDDIDGRSDMFSLATALYEMLTGARVFQHENASASLAAVLEDEVDPDARIPPKLWLALTRALAKRPYERQASCTELAAELRGSIDATDAELAAALAELRPPTDREPNLVSTNASSAILSASMATRGRTSSRGVLTGVALGVAVAAAIVGTMLVMRSPSATPVSAPASATTFTIAEPPAASTSTSEAAPIALPTTATTGSAPPPRRALPAAQIAMPPPVPTPAVSVPPAATAKKARPGDVATTPGF